MLKNLAQLRASRQPRMILEGLMAFRASHEGSVAHLGSRPPPSRSPTGYNTKARMKRLNDWDLRARRQPSLKLRVLDIVQLLLAVG